MTPDLDAHVFDFPSNIVEVWYEAAPDGQRIRTKSPAARNRRSTRRTPQPRRLGAIQTARPTRWLDLDTGLSEQTRAPTGIVLVAVIQRPMKKGATRAPF
jgi:hypothetical protein